MQVTVTPTSHMNDPLATRMLAYLCALGLGLAAFVVLLVDKGYTVKSPWALGVLAAAAALAERGQVQLERGDQTTNSISNLFVLFTAVVFGPLSAMAVAAASMLGAVCRPYMKRPGPIR